MSEAKLYFNGPPRDPDAQKLIDAFGVPRPGQEISYEEVAAVLGYDNRSRRWSGVTTYWRVVRLYEDHNIVMDIPHGRKVFRVLHEEERVPAIYNKHLRKAAKQIIKAHTESYRINREALDQVRQNQLDSARRTTTLLRQNAVPQVSVFGSMLRKAPEQLPRVSPSK